MKIRIKVKTLIMLVIAFALVFGVIIPGLFLYGVGEIEDNKKAAGLYEFYVNMPIVSFRDIALYKMAKSLVPYMDTYDIFMFGRGSSGDLITREDAEKAIECYERILNKYKNSLYYVDAYKNLLDIYVGMGNGDKVQELIDWGRNSSREEIVYTSHLYTAFNHMANRKYDEAMDIVEKCILEGIEDRRLYELKGIIYIFQEEYDLAEQAFEEIRDKYFIHENSRYLFGSIRKVYNSYWINSFIRRYAGDNTIKGRVTVNGKGIPYVQIYIHTKSQYGTYSPDNELYIAITDFNGGFETIGLKEGEYEIGIGVSQPLAYDLVYRERNERMLQVKGDTTYNFEFTEPMEIISPKGEFALKDSTFHLKWERIEGAEYYEVHAVSFDNPYDMSGSSIIYAIPDEKGEYEIPDTEANIDIDVVNFYSSAVFYSGEDEERIINPGGILGTFYPGIRVPIIVKAYDAEGNILNSTLPLVSDYEDMTIVKVENRELSEGERLIANMEYEEAISYYEDILERDDKNTEALTYLSRLYAEGWRKGTESLDKAREYAERLYSITGDDKVLIRINNVSEKRR